MNKFRLLRADEIECRISSISEKGLSLLLYKTARTDANLLDETVGAENWENDFKVVDGVLYGGIGIYDSQMDRWVWKWDAGTESNTEAEKGRASDAFKRAGFKHGIGRELYTAPFIWITPDKCEIKEEEYRGKKRLICKDIFRVVEIGYNEKGEINKLTIANDKRGVDVFWLPKNERKQANTENSNSDVKGQGKTEENGKSEAQKALKGPDGFYYCEECGATVLGIKYNGQSRSPSDVVDRALTKHGKQLCWECQKKREMPNS